jgi:hypothetical protein
MLNDNKKHNEKIIKLKGILTNLDMITIQIQNQTKEINNQQCHIKQICNESVENFGKIMDSLYHPENPLELEDQIKTSQN